MFEKIVQEIKEYLFGFSIEDSLILNGRKFEFNKENFSSLAFSAEKKIAFVDGGQAEIINAGNFCLSFIRIAGFVFQGKKKLKNIQNEFYLLTKTKSVQEELFYDSEIFPFSEKLVDQKDLFISSQDLSIKEGLERASISKVISLARRFAELSLASKIDADVVVLDGTLEKTFTNEEKYLQNLNENVCALAKTSNLVTTSGNNPLVLLNKLGPVGRWSYFIDEKTAFVKLHEKAKHVFRFSGKKELLPSFLEQSKDALFLGYPYGLILADKIARVSNREKNSLKMRFLLKTENRDLVEYLNSTNAHEILDSLG